MDEWVVVCKKVNERYHFQVCCLSSIEQAEEEGWTRCMTKEQFKHDLYDLRNGVGISDEKFEKMCSIAEERWIVI